MASLHILIVSQYFWPESFRINDLAVGLKERGHHVSVLTGIPNYPTGHFFPGYHVFSSGEVFEEIPVYRVPMISRGQSRGLRIIANYLSFALSSSLLGPMRVRDKFDLIFVFEPSPITVGLPAVILKKLKKIPIVFWVQDLWPETLVATGAVKSPRILKQVDRLVRFLYRQCDRILVQSRAFVDDIHAKDIPHEQIYYFPNWAESFFRPLEPAECTTEENELPKGFRILFAGNIGVSQSFETILQAAELTQKNRELHWVILGDGRERERVAEEIEARNLAETVHLLGSRPVESMPRYYAAADVLLATLKRDPVFSMTIPSKIQSYLACGKPIRTAIDGEGANIVREAKAGLTAPAEDFKTLAEQALRLFETNKLEREKMGQNGRQYFLREFERELLLDRLETIMQETVFPQAAKQQEEAFQEDALQGEEKPCAA